jgi:hypothetical protein
MSQRPKQKETLAFAASKTSRGQTAETSVDSTDDYAVIFF